MADDSVVLSLQARAYATRIWQGGPRGRDALSMPNWILADFMRPVGSGHKLTLELRLSAERWTLPDDGSPLLLGDAPFVDSRHPLSSPILGLELGDRIRIEEKGELELTFAARGESADGPLSYLRRASATYHPDAPLAYRVGGDVGRVASTVIGARLTLGDDRFELTAYDGTEPSVTDLELGTIDSLALRYSRALSPFLKLMGSLASVKDPSPGVSERILRYSFSIYTHGELMLGKVTDGTFIVGGTTGHAGAEHLSSVAYEFLQSLDDWRALGRFEVLQRTPRQLAIDAADPDRGRWVASLSFGPAFELWSRGFADATLGFLGTKHFLPGDLIGAYGGNPWSWKIYLRLSAQGAKAL
ncbi:MAG TPA: hypothetical protein VM598_06960 [Bdellovibrionota bacterium]|nr:hypothetical protein [Bdellovibrionota bacterium]